MLTLDGRTNSDDCSQASDGVIDGYVVISGKGVWACVGLCSEMSDTTSSKTCLTEHPTGTSIQEFGHFGPDVPGGVLRPT